MCTGRCFDENTQVKFNLQDIFKADVLLHFPSKIFSFQFSNQQYVFWTVFHVSPEKVRTALHLFWQNHTAEKECVHL